MALHYAAFVVLSHFFTSLVAVCSLIRWVFRYLLPTFIILLSRISFVACPHAPWTYRLTPSDADSMGHGSHVPPSPHFYKWLGTGVAEWGRRTANKKLTKLYWPSLKRSRKRLIVLLEPKFFAPDRCPHFRSGLAPPPTVKFVPTPLLTPSLSLNATYTWGTATS